MSDERPDDSVSGLFLLSREWRIATLRMHPVVLLFPFAVTLIGLISALIITFSSVSSRFNLRYVWLIWTLVLIWLVWKAVVWVVGYLVITSERVIYIRGVFRRRLVGIWLAQLTGLEIKWPLMGRYFNYGQLIFKSPCRAGAVLSAFYVPYVRQLELVTRSRAFPSEPYGGRHVGDDAGDADADI